jgi:hypothetical protein
VGRFGRPVERGLVRAGIGRSSGSDNEAVPGVPPVPAFTWALGLRLPMPSGTTFGAARWPGAEAHRPLLRQSAPVDCLADPAVSCATRASAGRSRTPKGAGTSRAPPRRRGRSGALRERGCPQCPVFNARSSMLGHANVADLSAEEDTLGNEGRVQDGPAQPSTSSTSTASGPARVQHRPRTARTAGPGARCGRCGRCWRAVLHTGVSRRLTIWQVRRVRGATTACPGVVSVSRQSAGVDCLPLRDTTSLNLVTLYSAA